MSPAFGVVFSGSTVTVFGRFCAHSINPKARAVVGRHFSGVIVFSPSHFFASGYVSHCCTDQSTKAAHQGQAPGVRLVAAW